MCPAARRPTVASTTAGRRRMRVDAMGCPICEAEGVMRELRGRRPPGAAPSQVPARRPSVRFPVAQDAERREMNTPAAPPMSSRAARPIIAAVPAAPVWARPPGPLLQVPLVEVLPPVPLPVPEPLPPVEPVALAPVLSAALSEVL